VWRGLSAGEEKQPGEAALADALRKLNQLEVSTAGIMEERNVARENVAKTAAQLATLQKELQETKQEGNVAKTGMPKVGDVSGRPAKARMKSPVVYPIPELDIFRAKELEWISKKQKSETMSRSYDNLIRGFNFNDSDREYFWALMEKREDAQLSFMPTADSAIPTPEQMMAALEKRETEMAALDQNVKTFLNDPADYQAYQNWERTKLERLLLDGQKWAFESFGEPLSAEQENQLVEIMHASTAQAFQDKVIAPSAGIKLEAGGSALNPKQLDFIEAALGTMSQYKDQIVLDAASKILSPAQVKILGMVYQSQAQHADDSK
jgi:hypothetical protein